MIKEIKKVWIMTAGFLMTMAVAPLAFAQSASTKLENPLNTTSSLDILNRANVFLLAIAAPICGIMVVWGGFQMITAAGNPEKFSSGKKTLLYAAIGFVVVLFAASIPQLIQNVFNGS